MASFETTINMIEFARDITMKVTLQRRREFRLRCWFGTKLIILAARIMGMGVKIISDKNPEKMERPKSWPDPPEDING